jgi:RNA polymerase sigma factor (TIGR02999 family)
MTSFYDRQSSSSELEDAQLLRDAHFSRHAGDPGETHSPQEYAAPSGDTAVDRPRPDHAAFADVYEQLKTMAGRQRRRSGSPDTLSTTELVHETFLRMGKADGRFENQAHYFAYAARVMRHILTDAARRRIQPTRGGDISRVALTDASAIEVHVDPQLALQLDDALIALERADPRAAKVVELRHFAGLGLQHIAEVLGVTRRTVNRDWRYARAFLALSAPG